MSHGHGAFFITPSLEPYMHEIENTVDKAVELHLADISYIELIRLIISGWPL